MEEEEGEEDEADEEEAAYEGSARMWTEPELRSEARSRQRAPERSGRSPRQAARLCPARAFSFTITHTNRHLTWALRTLPTYYATASALCAGCNALVIQVLHVPDTLRPICRCVRHTNACPTFGEQNRNRVDPCRRETLRRPVIQINITIVARQLHARVEEPLCRRSPSSSHFQTKRHETCV